jgi:CheY-like chemotaxis protein
LPCGNLRKTGLPGDPILLYRVGCALARSGLQNADSSMNRKKILIVDDSAIILRALSMKLKSSGYDVLTAVDGSEAVAAARQQRPDLILLDLSFPPDVGHGGGVPWDGFLIMDWLRRFDEAKTIPVIVITGGDPDKYKERALASGAVSYFQKPVDNEKLLSMIRQTLEEGAV